MSAGALDGDEVFVVFSIPTLPDKVNGGDLASA